MESLLLLFSFAAGWFVCWIQHNGARTSSGTIQAQCSKCAKSVSTTDENIRTPFYCSMCK